MDLSFRVDNQKFNYRVCAVILSEGKILTVYHSALSPYYSLPGGRVTMDETAEQAVVREVQEELGAFYFLFYIKCICILKRRNCQSSK